jgi:serine/threonine protein phosphatase PrpC
MIPFLSNLDIAHNTHAGETGKNNEDNHRVEAYRAGDVGGEIVTLAVVADGIGGHRSGEVASGMAVRIIFDAISQSDQREYRALIAEAIGSAAQQIAGHARSAPEFEGMGTTCALALVAGRRLHIAFIGDSRIYLARHKAIRQISIDHTWIQEAIDHKLLTREDAKTHPNRHVVRRHIGNKPDVQPDFRLRLKDDESDEQSEKNQGLLLEPGHIVILCSDGLTDLVEPAEILDAITARDELQAAVEDLILLARQRGGHDNITLILLRVPE